MNDEAVDGAGKQMPSPTGDRAAVLAALSAAIGRVGPNGSAPADPAGAARQGNRRGAMPAGTSAAPAGAATVKVSAAAPPAGTPARRRSHPPPDDPAGAEGDPPGDPESVARAVCLRLLTVQARSRAELAAALARRDIPAEAAARVLDRFAEIGLIDDAAYAEAFVASKHRDRGLGRAALRTELRRKGIAESAADAALTAVDTDAERRRATELVYKRLDSAIYAGIPAARRRLLALLARRGYPASLAIDVVNTALRGYADPIDEDHGFDGDESSTGESTF